MKTVNNVAAMQRLALQWRRSDIRVAAVPTMGCLHPGHASLIERARKIVGPKGQVVVSIFVNPTQFGPKEDFARYPRDLKRDKALCRAAGANVIFAPTAADMYPAGFSTWVVEESLSATMEGAARPAHFRGVATVVTKLFQILLPDVAIFGAKDFQQSAVVQRMARDLNMPARVIVAPTVREADGLAMSSRNKYLSPAQRKQATVLVRCLGAGRNAVARGDTIASVTREVRRLVANEPDARLDYVAFVDPETLAPARDLKRGVQMAVAVFIGATRLIDNAML